MQITTFTAPKDRSLRMPSDDTLLILPGVVGVFDGATSPQKNRPAGTSSGRIASQAAAMAVAALAERGALATAPAARIFADISARIRDASALHGMEGKPSTTMALAIRDGDALRFLAVGDTGIRLNGDRLLRHEKPIDEVSTLARIRVHARLSSRLDDRDEVERLARQVSFEGLREAVSSGLLGAEEAAEIRAEVAARFAAYDLDDAVTRFLDDGIRSQFRLANSGDHPLGYSTLNRDETLLSDVIDLRLPLADLHSIEIFSDGYFSLPAEVSVAAWERAFAETEAADFAKLGPYASVKGSTTREFTDDRSVIVVDLPRG